MLTLGPYTFFLHPRSSSTDIVADLKFVQPEPMLPPPSTTRTTSNERR